MTGAAIVAGVVVAVVLVVAAVHPRPAVDAHAHVGARAVHAGAAIQAHARVECAFVDVLVTVSP